MYLNLLQVTKVGEGREKLNWRSNFFWYYRLKFFPTFILYSV